MIRKSYDYVSGKARVTSILDGSMEVIEKDKLPKSDDLTFENSYHSWISAIFVDIRNSTELVSDEDQEMVAKIIRSFTSEIIEILRGDDELREIGIRGDCVYAIYTTPYQFDISCVFEKTIWINCYLNMLNKLLVARGYTAIRAGIGMAVSKDHVIKAGRNGVGISDHVWLGRAVSLASKLAGMGSKGALRRICVSSWAYDNFIERLKEENPEKDVESWFAHHWQDGISFWDCGVIMSEMEEWINSGMPD